MNWRSFSATLQLTVFSLALCLMVSCKKSYTGFKSGTVSDNPYADTDQRVLEREFKRHEKQLIRAKRRAERLARTRPNKKIEKVIRTARSYRGTPYRWGGTTRIGMDCSGLLCTSFKAINVDLPRTSNEQSEFGHKVRPRELRPGDLVFFGASGSSREISHVGMVTDIRGRDEVYFIHASTSLGVKEDNLYSNYYQKIFIKAVRPRI
jgi:probable lipoprotein NlpC